MITIYNLEGKELLTLEADSLRGANLIIITWSPLTTYITPGHIRIGCESHTLEEWRAFTDAEIADMHPDALKFWVQNKELIIGLCEQLEEA